MHIRTRIFGRATLILLLPVIDLRFFTAKAFFNILTTPTKSTSKLSCILHLAPRVTFNGSLPVAFGNIKTRENTPCYMCQNHNRTFLEDSKRDN